MFRYFTAGESHGRMLIAVIEGIPAGLKIDEGDINYELSRRQRGYGRGGRMGIESDRVVFLSGIRWGETIGSPITLAVENKDWENNKKLMSTLERDRDENLYLTHPRPGHADLAGMLKYAREDLRDIQERASARETAARVAVGAVCKRLLNELDMKIYSYVEEIGGVKLKNFDIRDVVKMEDKIDKSPVRCPDKEVEKKMMKLIDKARSEGDTAGGMFCVVMKNVPAGLGSHTQWDRKLDGCFAKALVSIQAVKAVGFGKGADYANLPGSMAHDEIYYRKGTGFYRETNNAGGIEGGMSNGEDIVIHAVMKPIPTLGKPLESVDIKTKKTVKADVVRSDTCAVPACSIVAESAAGAVLADAVLEKFSGDTIEETRQRFLDYVKYLKSV